MVGSGGSGDLLPLRLIMGEFGVICGTCDAGGVVVMGVVFRYIYIYIIIYVYYIYQSDGSDILLYIYIYILYIYIQYI